MVSPFRRGASACFAVTMADLPVCDELRDGVSRFGPPAGIRQTAGAKRSKPSHGSARCRASRSGTVCSVNFAGSSLRFDLVPRQRRCHALPRVARADRTTRPRWRPGHCAASRSESGRADPPSSPWTDSGPAAPGSSSRQTRGRTASPHPNAQPAPTERQHAVPCRPWCGRTIQAPDARSWSRTSMRRDHHIGERHALAGIEIEHHLVGMQRISFGRAPGVQFDRRNLRHGDQPVGIVDREDTAGRRPRPARIALGHRPWPCFWKKCSPPMPSGQRTIASGRCARPGSAWSAMACQYSARSCLVMPGHNSRSGCVRAMSPTVTPRRAGARAVTILLPCCSCAGCVLRTCAAAAARPRLAALRTDQRARRGLIDLALRFGVGWFTHHLGCRLVLAQAKIDRLAHPSRAGP